MTLRRLSGAGRSAAAAIALAALAMAAPARSAPAAASEQLEALQLMHKLAECAVKDHRASAVQMLAYPPGSTQTVRYFYKTNPSDCMGTTDGDLHMKGHFLRGAIAERLLRQDFSAAGAFTGKALPPIFAWPDAKDYKRLKAEDKANLAMISVGECATKAASAEVYALFATPIRSREESAAIRALLPRIESCVPQGESFQLDPATARAFLGEGAYRCFVQQAGSRQETVQ